jgi:hypothetical protein
VQINREQPRQVFANPFLNEQFLLRTEKYGSLHVEWLQNISFLFMMSLKKMIIHPSSHAGYS